MGSLFFFCGKYLSPLPFSIAYLYPQYADAGFFYYPLALFHLQQLA